MDIAFRMLVELSRTETGSLQRELTENALPLSRAWARTLPYACTVLGPCESVLFGRCRRFHYVDFIRRYESITKPGLD